MLLASLAFLPIKRSLVEIAKARAPRVTRSHDGALLKWKWRRQVAVSNQQTAGVDRGRVTTHLKKKEEKKKPLETAVLSMQDAIRWFFLTV